VIIKAERVVAAGCFLPLAEASGFSERLGTRHRAALGLTLQTDAVVLVVSEQTGSLALVSDGRIARNMDEAKLRAVLLQLLAGEPAPRPRYPWRRARAAA
jgi:diadenylate cyclase